MCNNKADDILHHLPFQMIKQLQAKNPTVAIMCVGGPGGGIDVVTALQGGAADYMTKPLDLDELIARIERHVQRQVRKGTDGQ